MSWMTVRLGEVISHRSEFIEIEPQQFYNRCRVQIAARGVVLRDRVEGVTIKTKAQQVCRAGEFLVAEIDAKMGGYGIVPEELDGAIVSSHYFLYEIDETQLSGPYLDWYSKTSKFFEQVNARGSTNYAAIRSQAPLDFTIPLPSLDEQREITAQLDRVKASLTERQSQLNTIECDMDSMLLNAFQAIAHGAEYRSIAEVAPLERRPIAIQPGLEYPELGARSFGRGLFHKPALSGASITWQKLFWIHDGDLVFSNIKAWEGAFGVASKADHMRVGSHRYLTCVPDPKQVTPNFVWFYLQTREGLQKVGEASPGSADRNRTLGQKALMAITVPVPCVDAQQKFDELCTHVRSIRAIRAQTTKDANALMPAILHHIFQLGQIKPELKEGATADKVVALPTTPASVIDTPFKEAVLVGSIVKTFTADGGTPLGNFRLQKSVYFARRHMGERALDQEFLRKAAGPYNPYMRYSGGIKIAEDKNWIVRSKGRHGEGSTLGPNACEMDDWIEKYGFARAATWVRDRFKFRKNEQWGLLATVDYARLALEAAGSIPTAASILAYIEADEQWRAKIDNFGLREAAIQNALVEVETLLGR